MEYGRLIEMLREWKVEAVPKEVKMVRGYDVDTYRAMARATERIDFDCDFRDGRCNGRAMAGNGCCTFDGCAFSLGYWRKEGGTVDEDTLRQIAPLFDEKKGFLRDGEGCTIPRELRSPTCNYVYCSDAEMSAEDKALLYRIQHGAGINQ